MVKAQIPARVSNGLHAFVPHIPPFLFGHKPLGVNFDNANRDLHALLRIRVGKRHPGNDSLGARGIDAVHAGQVGNRHQILKFILPELLLQQKILILEPDAIYMVGIPVALDSQRAVIEAAMRFCRDVGNGALADDLRIHQLLTCQFLKHVRIQCV